MPIFVRRLLRNTSFLSLLPPVLALFSCVCLVAGLFFQQVMPENKQLTLEKSSAA